MKKFFALRLRLWAIYSQLGYIPWHRPGKSARKRSGVYMGTKDVIPFMNDDAKRTISHLLLRPGYMMRDYILRGQHERYLAPITALLVFYSVFTLLVAVVKPDAARSSFADHFVNDFEESAALDSLEADKRSEKALLTIFETMKQAVIITHLDLYPDKADTPWKTSLAAVEDDLRSKGLPLFMGSFLLIWIAMALLLRKYQISVSGAAAASAYVLCQFCIFMFLALILSLGQKTELSIIFMGVLLLIDYMQLLGTGFKPALKLTIKTGLWCLLLEIIFYTLLGIGIILFALTRI